MLQPQKRISKRALTVWRITGMMVSFVVFLFLSTVTGIAIAFNGPIWIVIFAVVLFLIFAYFMILLWPKERWRRWRYEVREQEIELQRGIFVVTRTLIPMIRVQHVDTQQGPLLRKYELASVTISTAATVHEIPALDVEEAEEMRISISRLARVAEEDV